MSETGTTKTILMVDDEPWFVEPLKDALEFEGFDVVSVANGGAAIDRLKAASPGIDLVLLDIMCDPGALEGDTQDGTRTGVVLAKYIRETLGRDSATLPVLCVTVLTDDDVKADMELLGIELLTKGNTAVGAIVDKALSLVREGPCDERCS